jgi:hypothetical protein
MKADMNVEVQRMETVTLAISDNVDELTATEFFELVGELYCKLGYSNKVSVKVKGIHPSLGSGKLEYEPHPYPLESEMELSHGWDDLK